MRRHSTTSSNDAMPASNASTVARSLSESSDVHGDLEPEVDGSRVDVGVIAADDAAALEDANAAQAWRRREPYPLGELDVRQAPVRLELA